jgi:transposase
MIAEDPDYDGYVAVYLSYQKTMNQRESAKIFGMSQTTVSRWIARVEELIENGGEGLRPRWGLGGMNKP